MEGLLSHGKWTVMCGVSWCDDRRSPCDVSFKADLLTGWENTLKPSQIWVGSVACCSLCWHLFLSLHPVCVLEWKVTKNFSDSTSTHYSYFNALCLFLCNRDTWISNFLKRNNLDFFSYKFINSSCITLVKTVVNSWVYMSSMSMSFLKNPNSVENAALLSHFF